MVAKKYWEKPINEFINLVRGDNKVKNVEILGFSFQVLPEVFSPVYSSDTAWFAEKVVPLTKNKKFLEIGSGTGIIACLASINGASQVTATDINPNAVENICCNSKQHSLNISIREGSLFEPIASTELFDIIFWNHPFYCWEKEPFKNDMLALSVYDVKYQFLKEFFRNGKKYLRKNGQLILGTGTSARLSLIKKIGRDEGYKSILLDEIVVPVFKGKKTRMGLRIYAFEIR